MKTETSEKLVIDIGLACDVGLHESIVLTQLDKWLKETPYAKEGRRWVFKSLRVMQLEAFPFWDQTTIFRALNSLIADGYVIAKSFNGSRTKWLTIDYNNINLYEEGA